MIPPYPGNWPTQSHADQRDWWRERALEILELHTVPIDDEYTRRFVMLRKAIEKAK